MWKTRRREGGKMGNYNVVSLFRDDFTTYYKFRKAVKEFRISGYIIRNVCGGVKCFKYITDYENWKKQK